MKTFRIRLRFGWKFSEIQSDSVNIRSGFGWKFCQILKKTLNFIFVHLFETLVRKRADQGGRPYLERQEAQQTRRGDNLANIDDKKTKKGDR